MSSYNIFAWGANSHGQLCLGFQSEQCLSPQRLNISTLNLKPNQISKIIGGAGHTIILDTDGICYSCGWNHKGQLGISSLQDNLSLCRIHMLDNERIIDVASGWDSSIALSEMGNLFVWGSNAYGQLGIDNTVSYITKPFKTTLNYRIKKIAMGLRHTAIVTLDGLLLVTGAGNNGQLGLVDSKNIPIKQLYRFTLVPTLCDVTDVSCGQYYTIITTNKQEIFAFGNNKYSQLIIDTSYPIIYTPTKLEILLLSSPAKIICGWTHCIAHLVEEKKLVSWGRNTYGELGRGENLSQKPDYINSLSDVIQVSVGSEHNVAVTGDGKVFTWGWNEHGNCGNGDNKDVCVPTCIQLPSSRAKLIGSGAGHSFAIAEIET